jgi:hypothetical protein
MAGNYTVGYGKPPAATRFRKGQSGNPRGRAAGTRNLKTDLTEELAERIVIRENDQPRKVSKQRALVKTLTAKALKGDTRAANLVLNLLWRFIAQEPPVAPVLDLSAEDQAILARFAPRAATPRGDR